MYIIDTIYINTIIFREAFAPFLSVAFDCPVITVKPAPENGASIFINILLGKGSIIENTD